MNFRKIFGGKEEGRLSKAMASYKKESDKADRGKRKEIRALMAKPKESQEKIAALRRQAQTQLAEATALLERSQPGRENSDAINVSDTALEKEAFNYLATEQYQECIKLLEEFTWKEIFSLPLDEQLSSKIEQPPHTFVVTRLTDETVEDFLREEKTHSKKLQIQFVDTELSDKMGELLRFSPEELTAMGVKQEYVSVAPDTYVGEDWKVTSRYGFQVFDTLEQVFVRYGKTN